MKSRTTKNVIALVCIIAAYIIIAVVGTVIMIHFSMVSQQPESFIDPIEIQNENNWEEEVLRIFGNSAGNLQVFDSAGNLKADTYQMENDGAEADPMDYYYSCEKYISEVKEKRSIRKFTMVYDADQKAHRVVYIYGVSVENGNEMIGEAFVVHSPLYFSRTLRVFLAFFTAAYVIAAVSVILVLSMRRRYDDARQKYIDNVTHALKTPVTSIKALAETLYDGVESDPEEQRYNLQLILQQADLQVDMVQNILKLSRLQTYGVKPEKIKVSSEELVKDPVKKHLPECEQKNISLEISSHLQELPQLYTDPDMVRQILDAVLDNAVKFTPEGGKVTVSAKHAISASTVAPAAARSTAVLQKRSSVAPTSTATCRSARRSC